jgi:hypothetical protein
LQAESVNKLFKIKALAAAFQPCYQAAYGSLGAQITEPRLPAFPIKFRLPTGTTQFFTVKKLLALREEEC